MANTGFTTLVNGVDTDLIKIFEPLTGTKLTYNTNYVNSAGLDLKDIFEPYVAGDASANPTNYLTLSGGLEKDLNVIFAKAPVPFPTASNYIGSNCYDIAISGKNVVYSSYAGSSSNHGGIWYSSNYGMTFTKSTSSALSYSVSIYTCAISGNNAVACGGMSNNDPPYYFYYSTNAGNTWLMSTTSLPNARFGGAYNSMCISGTRAAGIVNSNATLYVSTDSGANYASDSSIAGCKYVTMNSTNYYYVVTSGGVYRSATGFNTATFTQKNTLTSSSITSISADTTNNNIVMFSTNAGYVYYSINNGDTWSNIQLAANIDVVRVSGNNAIAGNNADKNIYYVTKDAGTSWTTYTYSNLANRTTNCLSISGKNVVAAMSWSWNVMYGVI